MKAKIIQSSFVQFIDQNSDCLCPLILTNKMIIELVYQGDKIICMVKINEDFIAIHSSLLLNDLLTICIDQTESIDCPREISQRLKPKLFRLNIIDCT